MIKLFICILFLCIYLLQSKKIRTKKVINVYGIWDKSPLDLKYINLINHNKRLCKDWEFKLYDKYDIEVALSKIEKKYSVVYNKLPRNIAKADMARYVLAYVYGGFYLDLDVELKVALDDIFDEYPNYDMILIADKWNEPFDVCKPSLIQHYEEFKNTTPRVCNYAFYSEKGHPFLLKVLDTLCYFVEKSDYKQMSDCDVIWMTGPDLLTYVYHKFKFNNIALISAKGVPFNGWGGNGKYMNHKIFGSWRNNKDSQLTKI